MKALALIYFIVQAGIPSSIVGKWKLMKYTIDTIVEFDASDLPGTARRLLQKKKDSKSAAQRYFGNDLPTDDSENGQRELEMLKNVSFIFDSSRRYFFNFGKDILRGQYEFDQINQMLRLVDTGNAANADSFFISCKDNLLFLKTVNRRVPTSFTFIRKYD